MKKVVIWFVILYIAIGLPLAFITRAEAKSCGFYYYGLGGPIFGGYLAAAHEQTKHHFDKTEISSGAVSTKGCTRVTAIGQSLGVNTATEQANNDPKVTRVVLIDPPSVTAGAVVAKARVCGVQFYQTQEVLGGGNVKGSACIPRRHLAIGHGPMPMHPAVLQAIR